jgi:N-acetylmuramoyl-L-alanine amidase
MIILTAGHTGPNSGAQCATTQFDEGAENIWLRNRIAEILTNKYGLVVLMDDDRASLKLLTKALTEDLSLTELTENTDLTLRVPSGFDLSPTDDTDNSDFNSSFSSIRSLASQDVARRIDTDFVIDLHFNAHGNPQARGTETIVADDATELELRIASRLVHATADSLEIPLRGIKSESQTPHRRLAMLHLTPQSIILEVCFCTSPEDVEAYRKNREKLAADLAWAIAELVTF